MAHCNLAAYIFLGIGVLFGGYAFYVAYDIMQTNIEFRFPDSGNMSLVTEPFNKNDECHIIFDPDGDHGADCDAVFAGLTVEWYCTPEEAEPGYSWSCDNSSFPRNPALTKDCETEEAEDKVRVAKFDSYDNESQTTGNFTFRGPGYYVITSEKAGVWADWKLHQAIGDVLGGLAQLILFFAAVVVSCCWWCAAVCSCCVSFIVCLVSTPPIDPSQQQAAAVQMTYMQQPGMVQPGMMQPGMMQPGMMQPGMQPGMQQQYA